MEVEDIAECALWQTQLSQIGRFSQYWFRCNICRENDKNSELAIFAKAFYVDYWTFARWGWWKNVDSDVRVSPETILLRLEPDNTGGCKRELNFVGLMAFCSGSHDVFHNKPAYSRIML